MVKLAVFLALNGAVVLTIGIVGGLFLYRAILRKGNEAAWHLVHSGVSGRGVMLIALAAIIHLPVLPMLLLSALVWLVIIFTWTSTLAMFLVAVSGERGFRYNGSLTNRLVYILYVIGTIAIFPACLLLIVGLLNAL